MMRPRLLRAFGWRVVHVLAKDWYADREVVTKRLVAVIEGTDSAEQDYEDDELYECDLHLAFDEPDDAGHEHRDDEEGRDGDETIAAERDNSHVRRFECRDGKASKFWEITLSDAEHTVTFGRIGATGQTRTKSFENESVARRDCERLIREKTKKGYEEVK